MSSSAWLDIQIFKGCADAMMEGHKVEHEIISMQELKAIKLQQKAGARTLAQLQRNMTAVMGGFALELDRITARLRRIDPEPPALMSSPASTSLDFRDQQCRAPPANVTVSNSSMILWPEGWQTRKTVAMCPLEVMAGGCSCDSIVNLPGLPWTNARLQHDEALGACICDDCWLCM